MKKRKLLIGTLLATFACSIVGAICSIMPMQTNAQDVTYDTPAVYDLYDITGTTSFTSGSTKNRNIGQMPATHNVAFQAKVSYDKNSTRNLYMNLLLGQDKTVDSAYFCTNYGYMFILTDGKMSIKYDADPTTNSTEKEATIGASLSWDDLSAKLGNIDSWENEGSKINTANFLKGKETFLFEFGSAKAYTLVDDTKTWTGNYVYAKINGVEVISFTDTSAYYQTKGTYFGKGATGYDWTYYTFETSYTDSEISSIEKQVAVYDLYDITGKESGTYGSGYDGKVIGQLPYTSGIAFKTNVSAHAENTGNQYLLDLVFLSNAQYQYVNNCNGYRLYWRDGTIQLGYDVDSATGIGYYAPVQTKVADAGVSTQNSMGSFTLEFGSARYIVGDEWVGNYVYVKVDGAEILHFIDKSAMYKNREHTVATGPDGCNYSKYTFSTTYEDVANVVVEDAVVYDLYDVTGKTSGTYLTGYDNRTIGSLPANANVAFKTKVSEHEKNTLAIMFLDLIMGSGATDGYQLYWRDNSIHLRYDYDFTAGANTASENIAVSYGMHNTPENNFTSAFTMEFGIRKYTVDNEWVGNYVYVKINDTEVAHFIDKIDGYDSMGTGLSSGPWSGHAKYTYSTTYADSQIAYKLLDTFSMEKGASTRESGNGLRFTMTVAEDKWEELQAYIGEDKTYSSVSFGMVIVPADYVASKPLTVENLFGGAVYHLMEQNSDGSWKAYSGNLTPIFHLTDDTLVDYKFKGSIVDLEEYNITRKFVGLGYVKYVENDGDTGYVLADYFENDIANNTRSMYQVAKSAFEANPALTALQTNYLNKVAGITVNYYNADGSVLLDSETIYGVIGETAFAPLRKFDGYTFISGNNGSATQITVNATASENVLNYYFAVNE